MFWHYIIGTTMSRKREYAATTLVVLLILFAGFLFPSERAVAQSSGPVNLVNGWWQFDVHVSSILKSSDGSTSATEGYPLPSYTMVVNLAEVKEGEFVSTAIKESDWIAGEDAEMRGTIAQDNQVNWVIHYSGWYCEDAEMIFEGTLSQDENTMTGTLSPGKISSSSLNDCELWSDRVTGIKAEPSVTVNPSEVLPGSSVTVEGSGWGSNDTVTLFRGMKPTRVTADAAGNFKTTVQVPAYKIGSKGRGAMHEVTAIQYPTHGIWETAAPFKVIKQPIDYFWGVVEAVALSVIAFFFAVIFFIYFFIVRR